MHRRRNSPCRSRTAKAALSLALGGSLIVLPAPAWAVGPASFVATSTPTASTEPVRGGLEVDASALGEEGPSLQERIEERCKGALLEAEVLPARNDTDPAIFVEVRRAGAPEDPAFGVDMWVVQGSGEVADSRERFECTLCTEGELIGEIERHMTTAIEIVRSVAAKQVAEGNAAGSEPVEGSRETGEPPESHRPTDVAPTKRLTALGGAGIGVAVLGLVGVGIGAGLVAVDGEFVPGSDTAAPEIKATRGGGFALIGVGSAAMIAGVAMLAIDISRTRNARRAHLAPSVGPSHAGLALHGRF